MRRLPAPAAAWGICAFLLASCGDGDVPAVGSVTGGAADAAADVASLDSAGAQEDAAATEDSALADGAADTSAGGPPDAGKDAVTKDAGAEVVTPPKPSFSQQITGNWVRHVLGNCIDVEEWLQLTPPDGFAYVVVDRDACQPHSLTKSVGTLEVLPGQTLQYTWQNAQGWHQRRHTTAVLSKSPVGPDGWPKGYQPGTRSLSRLAYVQTAPGVYKREDRSHDVLAGPPATETVVVAALQITLDKPLQGLQLPATVTMTVQLGGSIDPGGGGMPVQGVETFSLPAKVTQDPKDGRLWIKAVGFENSPNDGSWLAFFDKKGWWKEHPAMLANLLYDQFRPVLWAEPATPEVLVHDAWFGWYAEMLSQPPKQP